MRWATVSCSSSCHGSRSQSNHEISLSWQYALLLPRWVRPISSPPSSIGVPADSNSVPKRLRRERRLAASTSTSSVGPSAPWLYDRLLSVPSLFFSPLASLCLSLYAVRSCAVKPSCAVTKLIDAIG